MRGRALVAAVALAACSTTIRPTPPLPALPFAADTLRERTIQPGFTHRFIYSSAGPWAIHVLDVDLACYQPVAVKGATGAIGREKTSTLLQNLSRAQGVLGGVNADFFLFTPPGVPTGAMITSGRVVTGPGPQPVFAFSGRGAPLITTLRVAGSARLGGRTFAIAGWNRSSPTGLALFDAAWSERTDTSTATIEVVLSRGAAGAVTTIDTAIAGVAIPREGVVLVAGRNAPDSIRSVVLALRAGDSVRTSVTLAPLHPREAVGGRPVLVRDSLVTPEVDTQGGPGFATTRHPRTAIGIAQGGRRIQLVVVDGRQRPYSDGMTLRELAHLMLALGARDALNLDGGGSTALVYADPDSAGALRVANRPSDAQGERAVGNALAIVDRCSR